MITVLESGDLLTTMIMATILAIMMVIGMMITVMLIMLYFLASHYVLGMYNNSSRAAATLLTLQLRSSL